MRDDINLEPLLVNTVGSWAWRPNAATAIENLFLASDYVRTYTDLATMEGANEAARRATNDVLDAAGSDAAPMRGLAAARAGHIRPGPATGPVAVPKRSGPRTAGRVDRLLATGPAQVPCTANTPCAANTEVLVVLPPGVLGVTCPVPI